MPDHHHNSLLVNRDTPILVTGATGFVGSYAVRQLLKEGYTNITGLKRKSSSFDLLGASANQIKWREADITDYFAVEDALEGQKVVIHCAALVSFQPSDRAPLMKVNRDGTRHLVDAALYHDLDYFVHISSVAALGRHTPGFAITEETKWEDGPLVSQYSRSKFFAELEVWRAQAEGLKVGVLYPSVIMGAGFWHTGTGRFFRYVNRGSKYFPAGSTGMVDVRDVALACTQLLNKMEDGGRYLVNGSHLSYEQILTTIAEALDLSPPTQLLAQRWAYALAFLEKIRTSITRTKPLLTKETVRASYQQFQYDNQRSCEKLDLSYRDVQQTLIESAAIFLATKTKGSGVLPI